MFSRNSTVWRRLLSFLDHLLPRHLRSSKPARIISMPRFRMFRKKYLSQKPTKLLPRNGIHLAWARAENVSSNGENPLRAYLRKAKRKAKQRHQPREWLTATGTEKKDDSSVYLKH
jgi:hypothetical protein